MVWQKLQIEVLLTFAIKSDLKNARTHQKLEKMLE